MKNTSLSSFLLLSLPFLVASCEKSDAPRTYTEISVQSQQKMQAAPTGEDISDPHAGHSKEDLQKMLQEQGLSASDSMKDSPLSWIVPSGWEEKAAGGMRIASFANKADPTAIDCSIVSLGGGAGGLAPNVIRWMQQIHLDVPRDNELNQFIDKQERLQISSDLTAILFDFTILQKDADAAAPSMVATIIDTPEQRIFVKMTGGKQNILNNLKSFKTLLQSLKIAH